MAYGFDPPPDPPANDNDAARFLTQATFGPTTADIARLKALGYDAWIEEQLGRAPTLGAPTVERIADARIAAGQGVTQTQRVNRWHWQATYAPDQLRQRMAWALSQIFVVSDEGSGSITIPMTGYYDTLTKGAFLPYRQLLDDVTWSPVMAQYLSSFRNPKPSPTTSPDENYAREIMQLFSVGLIRRNLDFSPALVGGAEVPTYDQSTVAHMAKVFTGFTYGDAPTNPPRFTGPPLTYASSYSRMACWGTELFPAGNSNMRHDTTGDDGTTATPKTVLGGVQIPPNQTCGDDVGDLLDVIATHPNVAPFMARQLIQRFVASNPSPAYIQRVAQTFLTTDGDLGDVVKAVLLDVEARNPPPLTAGDGYGKLREPLLRLIAMWRAFDAPPPLPDVYGEIPMPANRLLFGSFGQGPLESPSVFNFYFPDYRPPGRFATQQRYAPELQITTESTLYGSATWYYEFTANSYQGRPNAPTNRPLIDLSSLTVNANDPDAMVETINRKMLYGTMSARMRTVLRDMIAGIGDANTKAWSAIYVTMLSPEYATQR